MKQESSSFLQQLSIFCHISVTLCGWRVRRASPNIARAGSNISAVIGGLHSAQGSSYGIGSLGVSGFRTLLAPCDEACYEISGCVAVAA